METGDGRGAEIDLVALARDHGRGDDPAIRQDIARGPRAARPSTAGTGCGPRRSSTQGSSSPILSLGKLAMSRILHEGAARAGG